MVGEPRGSRRQLWTSPDKKALRPGPYVVFDKRGRRFTTANKEGYARRLATRLGGHVGICCPRCDRTSHHPGDVGAGYCDWCTWWTSDPSGLLNSPETLAQAEADGALTPLPQ